MNEALEVIWRDIQASPTPQEAGWVRRRANPSSEVPVYAAVENRSGARSLMIDIPKAAVGRLQALPVTRGLSMRLLPPLKGQAVEQRAFAVELDDSEFSDIFSIFCTDLVEGISQCSNALEAVSLLLRRLERWQELLSTATHVLSESAILGLFGELSLLRDVLVPMGGLMMLESWTGAQRAPQDFVVPGTCAVEVKTSAARVQSHVRIHGEQQLSSFGSPILFLVCLRVESDAETGESINDLVDHLRASCCQRREFALTFTRRLTEAGYLDRHRHRYDSARYRVAQRRYFRVEGGFPRLLAEELPLGVSDVEYRLELKACSAFECDQTALANALAAPGPRNVSS